MNSNKIDCDNVPNGPNGLEALFLAYIAGICGEYCSESERDLLIDFALEEFGLINIYQSDEHKIHPLLENQLEDRQLALDIYDVMTSLKQQRDEDLRAIGERPQ